MRRGKAVKALTPKVRPFRNRQVRGLQDCANREGGKRGSLLHRIPVSLSVVRSPPLRSLDANGCGPRSTGNGHSQLQWRPLRAQLGAPPTTRRSGSSHPRRAHGVPRPRCLRSPCPLRPPPGFAQPPGCCWWAAPRPTRALSTSRPNAQFQERPAGLTTATR